MPCTGTLRSSSPWTIILVCQTVQGAPSPWAERRHHTWPCIRPLDTSAAREGLPAALHRLWLLTRTCVSLGCSIRPHAVHQVGSHKLGQLWRVPVIDTRYLRELAWAECSSLHNEQPSWYTARWIMSSSKCARGNPLCAITNCPSFTGQLIHWT